MVCVDSVVCGVLEVAEENIIAFTAGIPGFEKFNRFALVQTNPDIPFSYLQSMDAGELTFVVVNPFSFFKAYEFQLSASDQKELEVEQAENIAVWAIVTVGDDLQKATANLFAPLVINTKTRKGKQVVLHDSPFSTRQVLMPYPSEEGR
jgi:flagellar assembly factor FliW